MLCKLFVFYAFIKTFSSRKTTNPAPPKTVGSDDTFECQAKPSSSRSLPTRSCKTKISYEDKSSSEDEQNFNDGKNSIQNDAENNPEQYDYYEEPSDEDLDPYGLFRIDTSDSD